MPMKLSDLDVFDTTDPDPEIKLEPIDEWFSMENEHLRQELEEMEAKLNRWKGLVDVATTARDKCEKDYWEAKRSMAVEINKFKQDRQEGNRKIMDQLLKAHSLIEEYERVVTSYVQHTGVMLVTNKIKELRKEGGFA